MNPVERVMQFFSWIDPTEEQREAISEIRDLTLIYAEEMVSRLPMNAETTTGLRKLMEAKEAFVRSILDKSNG